MFVDFPYSDNESINNISVLFLLRTSRANKKKGIPIVCRITANGQRCPEFYTGAYVHNASDFNSLEGTTKNPNYDKILRKIKSDIDSLISNFQIAGKFIDADGFYFAYNPNAKKFLGKNKKIPKTVFEVYDKFLELYKQKLDVGVIAENTYKRHVNSKNILVKYFKNLGEENFEISKIRKIDFENIKMFMLKELKFCNNHTLKNLSTYKSMLDFAVDSKFIEINPFKNCKMKKDKPQKIRLTISELEKLKEKVFATERVQNIADCFIFCCYTGLSFNDLKKFSIVKEGGKELIYIKRTKTAVETYIPIFEESKRILEKYDYILPIKSNQKHNEYLKEVQNILGFDKNLTTHVARKTFANIMLNHYGVPYETVSKMMAHNDLKTLKEYYAEVELERILHDTSHIE